MFLVAFSAGLSGSLLSVGPAAGVERTPVRNRVFLETLGAGLLYSLNYEIALSDRAAVRLGVSGLPLSSATYIVGLGMPTILLGRGVHTALIAAGIGIGWIEEVAIFESQETPLAYGIGCIGYQFQPHSRGVFIRGCFTPVFTDHEFSPWGGLSIGAAF
jgi:hypothetical protein